MPDLDFKLGFWKENSSPYYPQANGKAKSINQSLTTTLQRIINQGKSNSHIIIYLTL